MLKIGDHYVKNAHDFVVIKTLVRATGLSQLKSGRTSAPRLPQAVQTNRGRTNSPEQGAVIIIVRDYLWMFIDRLTDAMGVPSTKGLT